MDNYDQSDLNDEDIYLLDTFTQLFLWVGSQSNAEEKRLADEFALKYVAKASAVDGRSPDIPIIRIAAGNEPSIFTCHFHSWDPEYFSKKVFKDPYQAKLEALALQKKSKEELTAPKAAAAAPSTPAAKPAAASAATPSAAAAAPATPVAAAAITPGSFTLEQLKAPGTAGVDPARKEEYLDDATFTTVFGVDRVKFAALPKWKRDDAKKKAGLF